MGLFNFWKKSNSTKRTQDGLRIIKTIRGKKALDKAI